jgi:hypothetical protein
MTLRELEQEVRTQLTAQAVDRFNGIMNTVAECCDALAELGKLVHRREGMQFRVSTTLIRKSREVLQVDVRVAGTSIGRLVIDGKESREFEPHEENFQDLRDWQEPHAWHHERVATYIKSVHDAAQRGGRREFRPEARVEATFVEAFDPGSKEAWTRDLELVRAGPLAYQVPVPVGGSEKANGGLGYIDALARFGRGHGLRVFELKKPSATPKEASLAVRQAATYALALRILVCELAASGYRRMFNVDGKVRDNLRFVATPFVPVGCRAAVEEARTRLLRDSADDIEIKPLFFEVDDAGSRLNVSE